MDLLLEVKPFCPSDIERIAELEATNQLHPWSISQIKQEIELDVSHMVTAWMDGKLVAYVVFHLVVDELSILNLVVDKSYRRKSIATHLVKHVLLKAGEFGCTRAFLEVLETNVAACGVYRKLGFTLDFVRKSYYFKGGNALVMSKALV